MPETALIRNPDMFPSNYPFFHRSHVRENRQVLEERTDREPMILWPEGWRDHDIDRVVVSSYDTIFYFQEWKETSQLIKRYEYDDELREEIRQLLVQDNSKIGLITYNCTPQNQRGINHKLFKEYPITRREYYQFLQSHRKRLDEIERYRGKVPFLFILSTESIDYLTIINFTGSKYVLEKKILDTLPQHLKEYTGNSYLELKKLCNRLIYYLDEASKILEPICNEFMYFLIEGYLRWDFPNVYKYITEGTNEEQLILLEDNSEEWVIVNIFRDLDNKVSLFRAFADTMKWVLECIHFDIILEEASGQKRKPKKLEKPSYLNLVELTQKGKIFDYLAERINERYEYYERSRRAS